MSNVINSGMRLAGILVVAVLTLCIGAATILGVAVFGYWHQDLVFLVLAGIVILAVGIHETVLWRICHCKFDARGLAIAQAWTFPLWESCQVSATLAAIVCGLLFLLRALGVVLIRDFSPEWTLVVGSLVAMPFALVDLTRTVRRIRKHIAGVDFANVIANEVAREQSMIENSPEATLREINEPRYREESVEQIQARVEAFRQGMRSAAGDLIRPTPGDQHLKSVINQPPLAPTKAAQQLRSMMFDHPEQAAKFESSLARLWREELSRMHS
jgi:hypothetical protein